MTMTNEQSVGLAEDRLSQLKRDYMSHLQPIAIKVSESRYTPSIEEILECQRIGNEFFNYLETFVGRSGLLGAHENGLWVTGFAETCHSVLKSYIVHINFLRSYKKVLGGRSVEPDQYAFANMQRMTKEYLKKDTSAALEKEFEKNKLPISGFNMPAHEDKEKVPTWQLITSISIGLVCIVGTVILSILIPTPTVWQAFIFRGCFALGLAAVAVIVPGFLNVNAQVRGWENYLKILAGGAIAIFVLIWLVNPPSLESTKESQTSKNTTNKSINLTRNSSANFRVDSMK